MVPLHRARFGTLKPDEADLIEFYEKLGFFQAPQLNMPAASGTQTDKLDEVRVSPLQMALAAASLSGHGVIPAPRVAMAVNTLEQGWVVLPAQGEPIEAIQPGAADEAGQSFAVENQAFWRYIGEASLEDTYVTWSLAGTLPNWSGTPLVMVLVLEENNARLATSITSQLLAEASSQ
jgi:hypothetical protein